MRKSYFLLFLGLSSFSSLSFADSFYAGVQAGADFFQVQKQIQSEVLGVPGTATTFQAENRNSGIGGEGGISLGYLWQFQDSSLGLEAFAFGDGSSSKQTFLATGNVRSLNFSATEKLQGFYGFALKPGYLINEKARLYAKIGWVQGRFSIEGTVERTAGITALNDSDSTARWLPGWQLGAGTEVFLNPRLAMTFEYNHIQYNKRTETSSYVSLANVREINSVSYRPQSNNVLIGLTYYFTGQDFGGYPNNKDDGGYDI